ncbi:MAG TPA: 2-oxo-4-hydroxy-4-carboxy-5-ureidoimidazoline decarboxylase [Acidobacteriaceae bacterium]|jgi:2-oxo-4-hydroxy-4-carboxy-5-ureidoimidazoline decarboxylase
MTMTTANAVLTRWNGLDAVAAVREILPCCGSSAWANVVVARRPFADPDELLRASDAIWSALPEPDWCEAFDSHPRIGQEHARTATAASLAWSSDEQRAAMSGAGSKEEAAKLALAEGNRQYEERFGRIFIVCAAGRSAAEILDILNMRMRNTAADELLEAAEQQRQITQLRLRRWLGVN